MPNASTCHQEAPVARIASTGPGSTASIASAKAAHAQAHAAPYGVADHAPAVDYGF